LIIAASLKTLFTGMTIDVDGKTYNVQTTGGNQDMLDKFIAECDRVSADKFPLIFYVTNPVKDYNGYKECDTTIVILTNTNPNWLSGERTFQNFTKVIQPVYEKMVYELNKSPYIQEMTESKKDRYEYTDIPNFGLLESTSSTAEKDFNKVGREKSEKSVITDYVDARSIKLRIRIKTECIT